MSFAVIETRAGHVSKGDLSSSSCSGFLGFFLVFFLVREFNLHCYVLSFFHELGDNRHKAQGLNSLNNCIDVKGQTQPNRNYSRLLGDIQLLKSVVDALCTVEVADEEQCLVTHC